MTAKSSAYDGVRVWIENQYSVDPYTSLNGMIVYEGGWRTSTGYLVGLFYNPECDIGQFVSAVDHLDCVLQGMPAPLRDIAVEMINKYMLEDDGDSIIPLVTVAFWSKNEPTVTSNVPWDVGLLRGASLIETECDGASTVALAKWQAKYKMSPSLVAIAADLCKRRIASPDEKIVIDKIAVQELRSIAVDPLLRSCQHHLSSLGIHFPT
jgi:hypothetical protein